MTAGAVELKVDGFAMVVGPVVYHYHSPECGHSWTSLRSHAPGGCPRCIATSPLGRAYRGWCPDD